LQFYCGGVLPKAFRRSACALADLERRGGMVRAIEEGYLAASLEEILGSVNQLMAGHVGGSEDEEAEETEAEEADGKAPGEISALSASSSSASASSSTASPPFYTMQEADFIVAACRKYCPFAVRRFLEPACGTGRLLRELVARGYQLTGFDLCQPALSYLRRQLARRRLRAETFEAEMSDFRLSRPVDAAYCTVSTFRLLLTEQAARGHLRCIAGSLRPGGIYVLGFRLLPFDAGTRSPAGLARS